jgi:hypothetical protein
MREPGIAALPTFAGFPKGTAPVSWPLVAAPQKRDVCDGTQLLSNATVEVCQLTERYKTKFASGAAGIGKSIGACVPSVDTIRREEMFEVGA